MTARHCVIKGGRNRTDELRVLVDKDDCLLTSLGRTDQLDCAILYVADAKWAERPTRFAALPRHFSASDLNWHSPTFATGTEKEGSSP